LKFKSFVKALVPDKLYRHQNSPQSIYNFGSGLDQSCDIKADIQEKYGHNSDLLEHFTANKGSVVHKWHHYIPLYDRYFSSYRGKEIRFLEIGVSKGGSLQMWRKYFGDDAIIFGIDIDPECKNFNGLAGQVRIGSQIDQLFLDSVVKEMGGIDIVLDDGSHHMKHVSVTLKYLFPHLSYGGIYMIEDLHTAYWEKFGGGYRSNKNFFRFLGDLVDDMHHWYTTKGLKQAVISKDCSGIHIHDSMAVLDKDKVYEPVHSRIG
jgi:cephalosporin hydroxylase